MKTPDVRPHRRSNRKVEHFASSVLAPPEEKGEQPRLACWTGVQHTSDAPRVIREHRSHGGMERFRRSVPVPPGLGRDDLHNQSRYSQMGMWEPAKPTTGGRSTSKEAVRAMVWPAPTTTVMALSTSARVPSIKVCSPAEQEQR
jgi:hypothetical protein